jgi:hypothetical protein
MLRLSAQLATASMSKLMNAVAEGHRLADVGEELELVLEVLGREQGAVGELADVLHPVDDL